MQGQYGDRALVEFAFTSQATGELPAAARLRIARQAWCFNTRLGLTGELRFEHGRFRQVIEGPCAAILPLASRILTDPRHRDIAVRAFRSIAARRFATWTAVGFELPDFHVPGRAAALQNLRVLPLQVDEGGAAVAELAHGARIG